MFESYSNASECINKGCQVEDLGLLTLTSLQVDEE